MTYAAGLEPTNSRTRIANRLCRFHLSTAAATSRPPKNSTFVSCIHSRSSDKRSSLFVLQTRYPNSRIDQHTHADGAFDNRVTLPFGLLNSGSMYAEVLPWTVYVPSMSCGQTDRQTGTHTHARPSSSDVQDRRAGLSVSNRPGTGVSG